jgi:hypothetical protein
MRNSPCAPNERVGFQNGDTLSDACQVCVTECQADKLSKCVVEEKCFKSGWEDITMNFLTSILKVENY